MPESLDLFAEVRLLRAELEEHGSMLETLVRAQGRDLRDAILTRMKDDPALAATLELVDGSRSQGQIQRLVATRGLKGSSPMGISRRVDSLRDELHLVALIKRTKDGAVYRKTVLDRVLGISRSLPLK